MATKRKKNIKKELPATMRYRNMVAAMASDTKYGQGVIVDDKTKSKNFRKGRHAMASRKALDESY